MTPRPDSPSRRIVTLVVVAAAAVCVYAVRLVDPDLFGYFAYGRLFVEHGPRIDQDPFAYTSAGSHWIAFEYLAQILLWLAYDHLGSLGLIALKCLLGGVTIFFLWRVICLSTDDIVVRVPIFLFCTSTISRFFVFRPQLFTFMCFALFVATTFRFVLRKRAAFWWLAPAMILWVNTHGGFVAGLGAMIVAIVLRIAQDWRGRVRGALLLHGIRAPLAVLAACSALTLVNPWGIQLWKYVLTEIAHGTNRQYIAEWQPLSVHRDAWSFVSMTILTGTVAFVGLAAHRQRQSVAGLPAWMWWLLCGPPIALAYLSVRHVPLAVIWIAPVLALLSSTVIARTTASFVKPIWMAFSICAFLSVLLIGLVVARSPQPRIAANGTLLGPTHPCGAVGFLRERFVTGNLYNPLWWGGYITWSSYPAIRVAMDGRNISVFSDSQVTANLRFYSRDVTEADLDAPLRDDSHFLVVPSNLPVLEWVRRDGRWREIHSDADAALFVRAGASAPATSMASNAPASDPCPRYLQRPDVRP